MISFDAACHVAEDTFKARGRFLSQMYDTGDKWIAISTNSAGKLTCSSMGIFISKEDGSTSPFSINNSSHYKLLNDALPISLMVNWE